MIFDGLMFFLMVVGVFKLRLIGTLAEVAGAQSLWLITFFLLSSLYVFGGYDLDRDEKYSAVVLRSFVAIVATLLATILLNYLMRSDRGGLFGRGILLGSLIVFFLFSTFYRHQIWKYLSKLRSDARILIFISQNQKTLLEEEMRKNKFTGYFEWMVHDLKTSTAKEHLWSELKEVSQQYWSAWVIAAPLELVEKELGQTFLNARFTGERILDLSQFYENTWKKIPVFHLPPSWFFLGEGFGLVANSLRLRIKRLVDILIALSLLLTTWPFMFLTAILVKLESRGPAIYRQTRTGKDGHDFIIFKFRSMRQDAEKQGAQWAQKSDPRVTRIGKFIRLTRLDELPQLWNVLKGDMSFVGPRPERPEFNQELAEKIPYYNLRHLVRPGLTGWAQILYPYGASIEDAREKLQYDLYYIKNANFILDLQIVLKTISVVVLGKGR